MTVEMIEDESSEIQKVRERYALRNHLSKDALYSPLIPANYMGQQERERALIRWIKVAGLAPVANKRVLEIGCGGGGNLIQLIRLGFEPKHLIGNELLEDRALKARELLPAAIKIIVGDASALNLPKNSFDVILQSTVFSSILDDEFQKKLAKRMWAMLKPQGGVLWYDFIFNNPKNPDVRGIPIWRIHELFPNGIFRVWRLTLAPPISRRITKIHPSLYTLFNKIPLLRTHVLCWIEKVFE